MSKDNHGPLVSVILPFYKRYDFLEVALESVMLQTYENIEVLLINDASPDSDAEVYEIIKSFNQVRYFKLRENVGPSGARNFGIENSKGKYIAFLDSDDRWEKDKLSIQIKLMEDNSLEFTHTSYWRHNTIEGSARKVNSGRSINVFPFIVFHCPIVTPSVVIRKELLEESKFRPELRIGEDVLLWMDVSKKTKLHGINKALTHVYIGHQEHVRDKKIKEYGLSVIGREAFSKHPVLYFFHMIYQCLRKLINKII